MMSAIGNSIKNDIHDLDRSLIELRDHEGFNPRSKRTKSIELMIPHDSIESFPMHVPIFMVAMALGMTNQEAGAAVLRSKKSEQLRLYLKLRRVIVDVVNFDDREVHREGGHHEKAGRLFE
jgi:hypothetical protein